MVRHNNRERKSIIQSFLTYVVKQQDSSEKHNDCNDHSIDEPVDLIPLKFLLVPCCRAEISSTALF